VYNGAERSRNEIKSKDALDRMDCVFGWAYNRHMETHIHNERSEPIRTVVGESYVSDKRLLHLRAPDVDDRTWV